MERKGGRHSDRADDCLGRRRDAGRRGAAQLRLVGRQTAIYACAGEPGGGRRKRAYAGHHLRGHLRQQGRAHADASGRTLPQGRTHWPRDDLHRHDGAGTRRDCAAQLRGAFRRTRVLQRGKGRLGL